MDDGEPIPITVKPHCVHVECRGFDKPKLEGIRSRLAVDRIRGDTKRFD
jgi:hypothetical protein